MSETSFLLALSCPLLLGAVLLACGTTVGESDPPCGPGTVWNGSQCVVKPVTSATPTTQSPQDEVDLGLAGKAPGPCTIVRKVGLPSKLEETGSQRTFVYAADGALQKMTSRYLDKGSPKGFIEEPTTYEHDEHGLISKARWNSSLGVLEGTYTYDAKGVLQSQKLLVIKDFGTTSTDWSFTYGADGYVSGWTYRESQGDPAGRTVGVRADGPAKRFFDCEVGSKGSIVPGVCYFEYDDRARITRTVATLEGKNVSTTEFSYEGDRYVEWKTIVDGNRTSGERIVYDRFGNVAFIEGSQADSLPMVERQVYDYACWAGRELPQPRTACGTGGRPEAFSRGTCFERLAVASLQIY